MRSLASRAVLALAMSIALALAPVARATTALYLSEVEHAGLSDAIVRGTVVDQTTDRDPRFGRIRTRTTLAITERLMGETPAQIVIEQMGGRLGDEVLLLPGDAHLEPGEDLLLFVRQVDGAWFLTALEQSAYQVVPSLDGPLLEREIGEGLFIRTKGGGLQPWLDDAPGQPLTLERLRWILFEAGLGPSPLTGQLPPTGPGSEVTR